MSLYPIIWAIEHAPVRDAEERAILGALVMKGDFDGCNCYRSYGTLAEDDDGVAGYVVGTHDTDRFTARLESEWWPALRARYTNAEGMTAADRSRISSIMSPSHSPAELVAAYPAHIHMNLLPRLRGQRVGTRLLDLWIDQARAAGVKVIHLGASATNTGGIAFWTRSGFIPQREEPGVVWFGMNL